MLLLAGGATAAPATSERTEYINAHFNMCNGDFVALEGTITFVEKADPDAGTAFILVTTHAEGVSDSGDRYVFNDTFKVRLKPGGDFSLDERHRLISQGSEPNQFLIIHFDTENGSTFEFECRGETVP